MSREPTDLAKKGGTVPRSAMKMDDLEAMSAVAKTDDAIEEIINDE